MKTYASGGSLLSTTNYAGQFVYDGSTPALSFFGSPEGRVVKNGSSYEYQYSISDHQGNTRVVFSSAAPSPVSYTATMESENYTAESAVFQNLNNEVVFVAANQTAGGNEVVRMNQNNAAGPGKSLKVYAGDKVDMEVWCYFESSSGYGSSNVSASTMITAIAAAFGGSSGGGGESGLIYDGVNSALGGFGLGTNPGDTRPSAFINYVLVDQQYKVQDMGWTVVPANASFTKQKITIPQVTVKEAGYIYVYLSYENGSNNYVYFDEFKVAHTKTNVVQYNEYYPFGMQTLNSWTRENNTGNNFLGNGGTELNATSGVYDLAFRNYDPVLGRLIQIDPMADKYSSLSPYNFSANDPVYWNDPTGASPEYPNFDFPYDIDQFNYPIIDPGIFVSWGGGFDPWDIFDAHGGFLGESSVFIASTFIGPGGTVLEHRDDNDFTIYLVSDVDGWINNGKCKCSPYARAVGTENPLFMYVEGENISLDNPEHNLNAVLRLSIQEQVLFLDKIFKSGNKNALEVFLNMQFMYNPAKASSILLGWGQLLGIDETKFFFGLVHPDLAGKAGGLNWSDGVEGSGFILETATLVAYLKGEADVVSALKFLTRTVGFIGAGVTTVEGFNDSDGFTWGDAVRVGLGIGSIFVLPAAILDAAVGFTSGYSISERIGAGLDYQVYTGKTVK